MKTPQNVPYIMYKGVRVEKPYTQMNTNVHIPRLTHIHTPIHVYILFHKLIMVYCLQHYFHRNDLWTLI